MANPKHVAILRLGKDQWNRWRESGKAPEGLAIDLSGTALPNDLRAFDLSDVNLNDADGQGVTFEAANLQGASLSNADLSRAVFEAVNLQDANMRGAKLRAAEFPRAKLDRANLHGADMSFASIKNATIESIKIDRKTILNTLRVVDVTSLFREHQKTYEIPWADRWLNWEMLRSIGQFPLFGVSWTALVVSLVGVTTIGLLNETKLLDFIDYPIPIPHRMAGIIVSSLLLVVGSTLYASMCPRRIQHFSETAWVEEHDKVRIHYLAASMSRRFWQWATAVTTVVGGAWALWLVAERLAIAFRFIAKYTNPN